MCESIDRGNDVIIVQYVVLFLSLVISQAAQARCINYPVFPYCLEFAGITMFFFVGKCFESFRFWAI